MTTPKVHTEDDPVLELIHPSQRPLPDETEAWFLESDEAGLTDSDEVPTLVDPGRPWRAAAPTTALAASADPSGDLDDDPVDDEAARDPADDAPGALADDAAWKPLYRVGAFAAVVVLLLVPIQIAVFLVWPPPSTASEWLALYRSNPLVGLLDMDALMVVDQVLFGMMFLALYAALRRTSRSWMTIGLALELVSIAAYLSSNKAFEMLSISHAYEATASDVHRMALLGAAESMVATWQGTAFDTSYVLAGISILIAAAVMLRSDVFDRATAHIGLLFGLVSLVPPTAGKIGLAFALFSLVPMWIWLFFVARRLFELGRSHREETSGGLGMARPAGGARRDLATQH